MSILNLIISKAYAAPAVIELPTNLLASTTEFITAQIAAFQSIIYFGLGLALVMTVIVVLFGIFHK